ncbi:hypothetical protein L0F63_005560 [Massospora cicadina]|nr:hypothetical protein L0F63_005560 [Massospora cicadina]
MTPVGIDELTISYDTRRRRHKASQNQIDTLEASFLNDVKPCREVQEQLADALNMSLRSVQIWFQNRRAKARMSGQVLPPRPLHWKRPLIGNEERARPTSPAPAKGSGLECPTESPSGSQTDSRSEARTESPSVAQVEPGSETKLLGGLNPDLRCRVIRHEGLRFSRTTQAEPNGGAFSIERLAKPNLEGRERRPRYYHFIPEYERNVIALKNALEGCIQRDFSKEVLNLNRDGCPPPPSLVSSRPASLLDRHLKRRPNLSPTNQTIGAP